MFKRDVRLFLYDILECIEKIWTLKISLNRNLEIIGEAVKRIV